ncbi:hypothetical protein AA313_de0205383 [Arthrobotrys entomopaga]|nr:hypothetical protein AA313_de0205383 [Arthrobotrys entomopaga]
MPDKQYIYLYSTESSLEIPLHPKPIIYNLTVPFTSRALALNNSSIRQPEFHRLPPIAAATLESASKASKFRAISLLVVWFAVLCAVTASHSCPQSNECMFKTPHFIIFHKLKFTYFLGVRKKEERRRRERPAESQCLDQSGFVRALASKASFSCCFATPARACAPPARWLFSLDAHAPPHHHFFSHIVFSLLFLSSAHSRVTSFLDLLASLCGFTGVNFLALLHLSKLSRRFAGNLVLVFLEDILRKCKSK